MRRKISIIWKTASSKSCLELNSLQKSQWTHMSTSPRSEQGGTEDWCGWNIIMQENRKVDSLEGSTVPKIRIVSKNSSNKSCWAFNSVQKSQWAHMSTSLQNEAKALQRLMYVSNIILYWNGKVDSVWGSTLSKVHIISLLQKIHVANAKIIIFPEERFKFFRN